MILDTFRRKEKEQTRLPRPQVQDLVRHDTSDFELDLTIRQKLQVIKNHLKMSVFISILLFSCLVMPYFLKWYSEPSSINGGLLYFGLNQVWVPT